MFKENRLLSRADRFRDPLRPILAGIRLFKQSGLQAVNSSVVSRQVDHCVTTAVSRHIQTLGGF